MKTRLFNAIVTSAVVAWLALPPLGLAGAEEEKPGASADVAFLTRYVWRGYALSDDSMVIQPSAGVSYRGFGVNLWGNLDTDEDENTPGDTPNDGNLSETDMTLSYDTGFGPVGIGVGYIYYALDGADDTEEFYGSVSLDTFLSPTLTVYREVADLQGYYVNFGISHSVELPKGVTLDLAGSVGYYHSTDKDFVEVDKNLAEKGDKYRALHDGLLSAALTIPFGKYLTVSPTISYSFPLTEEAEYKIKSGSKEDDSDFLYGGLVLSIAF